MSERYRDPVADKVYEFLKEINEKQYDYAANLLNDTIEGMFIFIEEALGLSAEQTEALLNATIKSRCDELRAERDAERSRNLGDD